ncbi:hypothetical protein [Moorena sp. SIO3H5]|uniref:hypothetical protein n=1 Tax=Moorena sp. SIO3H5 TaxID=2607834 RepID=UPI0013B5C724|nr:hypothetical protein [Moorena sp. SIO3H5]NEO68618.1 hypothetical protein [Moorena sp. SIO3H5]
MKHYVRHWSNAVSSRIGNLAQKPSDLTTRLTSYFFKIIPKGGSHLTFNILKTGIKAGSAVSSQRSAVRGQGSGVSGQLITDSLLKADERI